MRPRLTLLALAGAVLLVAGCGGGGSSRTSSSAPTATPSQSTATSPPTTSTAATAPTTPSTPTPTGAAPPTITQVQAKSAARSAAVRAAARAGLAIPAGQWDSRCTAVGGRDRATTWRCQVASLSGQCSGTVTAYAVARGVAGARDVRVACSG